jgi:HEAT repeats
MSGAAVTTRRRRVRIALAAGALLGVGAIALDAVRVSRHGRAGAGEAASVLGPFRVGEEVQSRTHVTVRLDLGRGAPPQEMELEGEWRATVTDVDGGLATVACELAELRASAGEGVDAAARQAETGAELARELGRRFFVRQRANGAVFEVWLPRGMKPAMANILLTLVGEAQLVRPAQAQSAWILEERDVNGAYLAAYQETEPNRFHKQKARYLDVAADVRAAPGASAPTSPHIRIDRSDIDLVADVRGRLLELRADDTTTIALSGLSFTVSLRFTLENAQLLANPALAGAFAREQAQETQQFEPHPMAQLGLDPAAEAARRDRTLLAGASADFLVAELRALPVVVPGERTASTLVARWEALLRLEPATAARIPPLVRGEPVGRGKLLVDALSGAGTAESQAALAAIAAEPAADPKLRLSAVQYLGLQPSPTPAALAGLRALLDHDDLGQAALLALGACARGLRPTAPDKTRELVGELQTRLARASDVKSRQDLVVALGNAGDPSSLPALRVLIDEKGGALRTPAIEALRFIADPTVDSLLGSLLGQAGDTSARFAAISAIRFREVGPFAMQLAEIARHDPVDTIRRAAIDLLGSHLGELPALRDLLQEVAHGDPARSNREVAEGYLARG